MVRNRIKRRLREAFRMRRAGIASRWDIVLNVRRAAALAAERWWRVAAGPHLFGATRRFLASELHALVLESAPGAGGEAARGVRVSVELHRPAEAAAPV